MQFYKIEAVRKKEEVEEVEEVKDGVVCEAEESNASQMCDAIAKFNKKLNNKACFFVYEEFGPHIHVCVIQKDPGVMNAHMDEFFKAIDLDCTVKSVEETTLLDAQHMLQSASMNDYIWDEGTISNKFGLHDVEGCHPGFNASEDVVSDITKEDAYTTCDKFLIANEYHEELDRIYQGKGKSSISGHPVHYIVETNSRDMRKTVYRTLVQALYANHRVQSQRYSCLSIGPASRFGMSGFESWYKNNIGGTVILRYAIGSEAQNSNRSAGSTVIHHIAPIIKKYRNEVLTIVCLPRECESMRAEFLNELQNVSFIDLKEEAAYGEDCHKYLARLAKEKHVRADKNLTNAIKENKGYLVEELVDVFDRWYDNKLKAQAYPQYATVTSAKKEIAKEAPKGDAYADLNEMIGLDSAKKVINRALNFFKAQRVFAEKGAQVSRPSMHMVFTGNPGTAKTSVARLFARILHDNKILSKGHLVEVGRGDLVAQYVGQTAPKIQEKFREALGGVLFIDEAYSLVDDRDGSFGDEAINTIVQEMENYRDDLVVVFAGYPDKMEEFLKKNPGLRSRIAFHIPFNDYTADELCAIAKLIAKQKGKKISDGACEKLKSVFEVARTNSEFGNGRYVRNAIEQAEMAQASRLLSMDVDSLDIDDINTICEEDIEVPEVAPKKKVYSLGFTACA